MEVQINYGYITESKQLATIYRKAQLAHLKEIEELAPVQTLKEAQMMMLDSIIADGDEKTVFVARNANEPVGFIVFGSRLENLGSANFTGEIFQLYVDPTYWRCGIGKKLIDRAMEELAKRRHTDILLWVMERSEGTREFYQKEGWVESKLTRPDYEGFNINRVCLHKDLSSHPMFDKKRGSRSKSIRSLKS